MNRRPISSTWWGHSYDARPFLLISLALFTVWTLVACYRTMRLELQMRNGPLVWLGFLAVHRNLCRRLRRVAGERCDDGELGSGCAAACACRHDIWLSHLCDGAAGAEGSRALSLAGRGAWRGPHRNVANGLQAWMMSYLATLLFAGLLIWWQARGADMQAVALIAAGIGFLTRDVSLFVLIHTLGRQARRFRGAAGAVRALRFGAGDCERPRSEGRACLFLSAAGKFRLAQPRDCVDGSRTGRAARGGADRHRREAR